jgi:glycosyltransferase involved in cell wall biosynthesis
MRILWVKVGGLWPPTTGGRLRSLRTISELSTRHQVTLVTTHASDDDPDGLARELGRAEVISLPFTPAKRGSARFPATVARSWLSREPVDLWKWHIASVRDRVTELIAQDRVDVCIADFLFAVANVPLGGGVPVVLFEHNVEYLIWKRLCDIESSSWKRALFAMEWRKLRAREADACRRADLTIAVSDNDRRRLSEIAPGADIASIPTGVDIDYFAPSSARQVANRLVFSGSMDWHPNEDAVLYFLDQMYPRIRAEIPDVSFTVAGRNPTDRLKAAAAQHQGVTLTGTVPDVRPAILESELCIVPLRAGSGTRLKILEALAMGKAVISTTVGAEGLGLVPDEHFVAADTPPAFAAAVVSLLRDPGRRDRLGAAGRALVEATNSWAEVTKPFERLCQTVVDRHAHRQLVAQRRVDLPRAGLI